MLASSPTTSQTHRSLVQHGFVQINVDKATGFDSNKKDTNGAVFAGGYALFL